MRNNVIVALVGVLAVSAPAFAKTAAPAKAAPKTGDGYVLGKDQGRTTLTQDQVDEVMKGKVGDVVACWQQLPDDQRAKDATAVLTIEIDDTGEVQTVTTANVSDDMQRCVSVAAAGWDFPRTSVTADARTFQYAVVLKAEAAAPAKPTQTAQK